MKIEDNVGGAFAVWPFPLPLRGVITWYRVFVCNICWWYSYTAFAELLRTEKNAPICTIDQKIQQRRADTEQDSGGDIYPEWKYGN